MTGGRFGPYAVFRLAAVRNLLLGGVLVRVGAAAQGLAIGWEMYQRTDQPLALGLIGLVQAVPMLLFTLPAGYLADVFDRRCVMVAGLAGTTLTSLLRVGRLDPGRAEEASDTGEG